LGTLFNPKSPKHKVVGGKISGLWRVDKWHGSIIPNLFVKVDILVVHVVEVPLMVTNEAVDQFTVGDAIGLICLMEVEVCKRLCLTLYSQ
jgi:hypothetical protein